MVECVNAAMKLLFLEGSRVLRRNFEESVSDSVGLWVLLFRVFG